MRKTFKIAVYIFAAIGFILVAVYIALELGWTKTPGIIDKQHDYFKNQPLVVAGASSTAFGGASMAAQIDMTWSKGEEWQVLKSAIMKDEPVIKKAAVATGLSPRLVVATLIVEQLRLFHDNREIFKTVFAPLKILGNQSQFSWGVMGIKQDTARQIENNLRNATSSWYSGPEYSHLLDFSTSTDTDTERFNRLTDEHDRYYSYLYAAVCLKEIETQWNKAGFPISGSPSLDRPEILATLFNIGFANSKPNASPQVGGAEIDIGTSTYSFGGLAGSFYYSDELIEEFPR